MTRRLYLDLDGVMADFDAFFPALFQVSHRDLLDQEMWDRINAHPSFFEDMPACPGALDFYARIASYEPIVLTACPRTNYASAARQKRNWVRKHLGAHVTVLPVMGGYNKPLFMHARGDVLIDDWRKNCEAWGQAGGLAIHHQRNGWKDTFTALEHVWGGHLDYLTVEAA
jgi:5'-nucleotidase